MSEVGPDPKQIFLEALERNSPEELQHYLDEACGGSCDVRSRVEALLRAHRDVGNFLGGPPAPNPALEEPVTEKPGTLIGPYKLLEQIGEGGFGVVFMAEQAEPLRRKVALKVLKPGMDTRQVVARFEAERQALALMDHPNIAHVFDGGETAGGRPYFVMELVKGIPITDYCDQSQLTLRERLELFLPLCHAVQHAHQKGIIHRDLKPSNVLVTLHDGTPVPKIIDFGIAKALGQQLTDKTMFTGFAQLVGTPLYMAPEQTALSGVDADTRSDIYSLGVLLYELFTGTTPFDKDRLRQASYDEVRRIIREEEPPLPSTRISTLGKAATTASLQRKSDPKKLSQLFRGELDWVVMRCLEKDRNRRYETANGLAKDIERYLHDEPVQACPPTALYRVRKFARRHKGTVLAVTAIFLLLIGGIAGTTWGMVRAEHAAEAEAIQRRLAEAAALSERKAKEAEAEQRNRAETALKKAAREAAVAAAINDFLNSDLLRLSSPEGQASHGVSPDADLKVRTLLQRAAKRIDGKFPNEPEVEMKLRYTIGYALGRIGDHAGALAQFEMVAALSQRLLGRDDAFTLNAEYRVASMHKHLRHFDIALPLLEENLERHKTLLGQGHVQSLIVMNGLAMSYYAAGQKDKALQLAEQTLELRKRHLGSNHIDTLVSMSNLAWVYLQKKQTDKALPLLEEALAGLKSKYPPLHPERLVAAQNLANAYHAAEQIDRALPLQETVTGQFKTAYGPENQLTQGCIDDLIAYYVDAGSCDKAEALLKSIQAPDDNRAANAMQRQEQREKRHRELIARVKPAAEKYQQALAATNAEHPDALAARQAFAVTLRNQMRTSAAAYHLKAVLEARQRLLGADHFDTLTCRLELGTTRLAQKRYAEAESLLLDAFAGLKQHENTIPEATGRLAETLQRLVQLYDGWEKKEKADEWRRKLDEKKK